MSDLLLRVDDVLIRVCSLNSKGFSCVVVSPPWSRWPRFSPLRPLRLRLRLRLYPSSPLSRRPSRRVRCPHPHWRARAPPAISRSASLSAARLQPPPGGLRPIRRSCRSRCRSRRLPPRPLRLRLPSRRRPRVPRNTAIPVALPRSARSSSVASPASTPVVATTRGCTSRRRRSTPTAPCAPGPADSRFPVSRAGPSGVRFRRTARRAGCGPGGGHPPRPGPAGSSTRARMRGRHRSPRPAARTWRHRNR